ncbi:MAG: hypothetical protein JXA69_13430 [Phycisphaerae bacterium]|nr:hypothetical protein [Phycisphaerae bacterium]
MSRRFAVVVALAVVAGGLSNAALATNVNAASDMSAIQGAVTGDNTITFNTDGGILTMNANGTGVQHVIVQDNVDATIAFGSGSNNYKLVFDNAAGDITLGANSTLTVTGTDTGAGFDFSSTAAAKTLTITSSSAGLIGGAVGANRIILGGTNTLLVATAGSLNAVVIDAAGSPTITVNDDVTIATLMPTGSVNLNIATAGKTLTLTNAVSVPASKRVILTCTNDASAETLAIPGGLTLNGSGAELNLTGDTTTAMAVTGTVTCGADGGILDIDGSSTITAVTMTSNSGDMDLQVAAARTLTTTVDVNNNTLTLSEAGTVSAIQCDTTGSAIRTTGSGTITTLTMTTPTTIQLATDTVALTLTNTLSIGAAKLSLSGSGGGGQETLNATIQLNNAVSELEVTGADADNITGTTLNVTADGPTIDTNVTFSPTAIGMTTGAGDLTLEVAAGKTLTTTVDVNANELTLAEGGTITTVRLDTAGGALDVNASCTLTTVNVLANSSIDVAASQTLTSSLSIGAYTLTLPGDGTITSVAATTGTITANGSGTITTLTVSPGASNTFTYNGTGDSTVTTLTALDATGETFAKAGTGALTVTNGFSFAGASGIKLNIDAGTFVDAGGNTIVFGDNAEEIVVANGATYTTSSSLTGQADTNTQLDAVAGSTVNFAKAGVLTLTSTADDDFKLLGTVNVNNGCTVALAGAFRTQWGNVNVKNTGILQNLIPNSTMLFAPSAVLLLEGTGSGTLTIDGQAAATPIALNTTTGSGAFTLNAGASSNMTIRNATLTNATYASTAGGPADAELPTMTGVVIGSGSTNWISALAANAGPDKSIINGNSTTLDGAGSGGSGTYTFAWTPTTALSDATVATPTASPTETTTYTLTVTDAADTTQTASDTVVVTVTPALSVTAGADKEIQLGGSVTLDGAATGGTGTFTYAWTPATGLDDPTIATPTATPTVTTEYTLTVTDIADGSKTGTDAVIVTVIPPPPSDVCGAGLCGAGVAPLMPLTLMGLVGWRWCRRRR